MGQKTLKRATGNWVVGDQFWDREDELSLLIERLDEGAHVLLVGQRRMGKTNLMREAARRVGDRYVCLHIDLQKAESAADAIVEMSLAAHQHKPLWDRTRAVFQNVLRDAVESIRLDELTITLRSGLTAGDWRAKGDRLFEILSANDQPVILFFDEVAILVNRLLRGHDYEITAERRQAVDEFLSWLRSNSMRHQGRIRMVLTGSIGLEPIVRQAGLSATLNHLTPLHLEAWNRDVAAGCLEALARGYGLNLPPDVVDGMLSRLGEFIPHHVQMFFDYVYQMARLRKLGDVTEQLVEEVYDHSMLGIRGHIELSHLEERLRVVLGPSIELLALDLLTEAAVSGSLAPEEAQTISEYYFAEAWRAPLSFVLGVLEHDGYLRNRRGHCEFASALVKDWWKARFEFAYVPVSKRIRKYGFIPN